MNNRLLVIAHPLEATWFVENNLPVLITGYGKINATLGLTRRIEQNRPTEIIVYGTAGRINKNLNANTIYEVIRAHQWDALTTEFIAHNTKFDNTATIATGDNFVNKKIEHDQLVSDGADLVDMETYAYMLVGKTYNIPVRVFKIISDDASDGADETWDSTINQLSEKLYNHYVDYFI